MMMSTMMMIASKRKVWPSSNSNPFASLPFKMVFNILRVQCGIQICQKWQSGFQNWAKKKPQENWEKKNFFCFIDLPWVVITMQCCIKIWVKSFKIRTGQNRWKDLDWLNGAGGNGHIHLIKTEIEQRSTCDEDVEDIWCFKMPCLGW